MIWYAWVMCASMVINSLVNIYMIDKPRQPTNSEFAIFAILINALFIWGIISLAT